MPEGTSDVREGRLANTRQNRAAGRALRAARLSLGSQGSKQTAFAATLSRELGMPFTATAVSGWENGKRSVPGAVLVAAAMMTGQSLDALLGEAGEPDVVQWAETLGLPQRLSAVEQRLKLRPPPDDAGGADEPAADRTADLEAQLAELAQVVQGLQKSMDVVQELLLGTRDKARTGARSKEVSRTPE